MIRVRVVSRSPVVKAGLESVLAGRFEITSEAADVIVTSEGPDQWDHDAPVVALTTDMTRALALIRSGAAAVLPAQASIEELAAAVEAVAAGLIAVPAESAGLLLAPVRDHSAVPLSPREREVLGMIASGLPNKEIAYRLGIAESTVKFHVASVMTKLNAGSRAEAVALGIRQGIIPV